MGKSLRHPLPQAAHRDSKDAIAKGHDATHAACGKLLHAVCKNFLHGHVRISPIMQRSRRHPGASRRLEPGIHRGLNMDPGFKPAACPGMTPLLIPVP